MNMLKNKLLRILGFILVEIYIFGVCICFAARWYGIGILGLLLMAIWLNYELIGNAIYKYRVRQATRRIKKCGVRLFVDLSKCKVIEQKGTMTKSRIQERVLWLISSKRQFWNGVSSKLFPDIYHKEQIISTSTCTVTFTTEYDGKTKSFRSDAILKDKVTLEMLLLHYETAIIYINPNNNNQYYFDLDFLR